MHLYHKPPPPFFWGWGVGGKSHSPETSVEDISINPSDKLKLFLKEYRNIHIFKLALKTRWLIKFTPKVREKKIFSNFLSFKNLPGFTEKLTAILCSK